VVVIMTQGDVLSVLLVAYFDMPDRIQENNWLLR